MTSDSAEKKRLVEQAFSLAAPVYDRSPSFTEPGRRLVELADIRPGDRVLDIATGRGAVLFPAAERAGSNGHVQGIDLAEPMVQATGRDIVARGIGNADVRTMDAEHLEFDTGSFDQVLCGFALWFIPNLNQALTEIRRVLKPGGRFSASTWGEVEEIFKRYYQVLRSFGVGPGALGSHSLTTVEAVDSLLVGAGFTAVNVGYMEQTILYRDEDDWWERSGSSPQVLQGLTPKQIELVKQEALGIAREFKDAHGIRTPRKAVLATGVSPLRSFAR